MIPAFSCPTASRSRVWDLSAPLAARATCPSEIRIGAPTAASSSAASIDEAKTRKVGSPLPAAIGATAPSKGRTPTRIADATPACCARASTEGSGRGIFLSPRTASIRFPETSAEARDRKGAHQSSVSNRSRIVAASTRSASAALSWGTSAARATAASSARLRASRMVVAAVRARATLSSILFVAAESTAPDPRRATTAPTAAATAAIAATAKAVLRPEVMP